ncbi:MAG TPA: outer membrane beta-barrel protein [Steroidobacteraceae bacterium]|nr:outer membrane beta-barrel protein [Steroidobacteraceae bacterium]
MNTGRLAIVSAATAVAVAVSSAVKAADPFGLYIGGAVGQADLDLDRSVSDTAYDVHMHHTGWKAVIGIRPLPILGAELEYLDFGNPSYAESTFAPPAAPGGTIATTHTKAEGIFGVLYAPIPIPMVDIFGKVGAARTQFDLNGQLLDVFCPVTPIAPSCPYIADHQTETDLAYGAGVQLKFGAAALRAEYERINASFGAPYMFSFGVTWTLL